MNCWVVSRATTSVQKSIPTETCSEIAVSLISFSSAGFLRCFLFDSKNTGIKYQLFKIYIIYKIKDLYKLNCYYKFIDAIHIIFR